MNGNLEVDRDRNGERSRTDRRVLAFELCLMVLVAFGKYILGSFYEVPGVGTGSERFHASYAIVYLGLHLTNSLALLGYVLWRTGLSLTKSASLDPGSGAIPQPPLPASGLAARIQRVSRFEWSLVFLVACWDPLSYFWRPRIDWLPEVLVRNITGGDMLVSMAVSLALLGYVLERSGRDFRDIGLNWSGKGAVLALPLFLFASLVHSVQTPMIQWLGQTFSRAAWHPPDVGAMINTNGVQFAMVAVGILVGFYEELIVRAYLMTEILALTRRVWLAVGLSVAVQTSYHFYQGVPLALSHVLLFTTFALIYAKTRSILPVAVAHSLLDVSAEFSYGLRELFSN